MKRKGIGIVLVLVLVLTTVLGTVSTVSAAKPIREVDIVLVDFDYDAKTITYTVNWDNVGAWGYRFAAAAVDPISGSSDGWIVWETHWLPEGRTTTYSSGNLTLHWGYVDEYHDYAVDGDTIKCYLVPLKKNENAVKNDLRDYFDQLVEDPA